jgi:hypothetical protein
MIHVTVVACIRVPLPNSCSTHGLEQRTSGTFRAMSRPGGKGLRAKRERPSYHYVHILLNTSVHFS